MSMDNPLILMIAIASMLLLLALGVVLGCVGFAFYQRLLASHSQVMTSSDSKSSLAPPPSAEVEQVVSTRPVMAGSGTTTVISPPQEEPSRPERLVYGSYDNPAIEICRYEARGSWGAEIPLNEEAKVNLSALLSQAPNLAQNAAVMSSNVYRLVFKPEVAQGLMNGTLEHISAGDGGIYAVVRDATGKEFAAQGSLHRIGGVNPATVSLAVWQVMALVTQQKYLADIDRRLAAIERGVAAVQDWLEDDRKGKIIGNLNYLRHIAAVLLHHRLTMVDTLSFNQQIEQIERECGQIMEAIAPSLEIPTGEFRKLKLDGAGLEKHFEAAKECINGYDALVRPYVMALYVRAVAAQLKCALPVNRSVARSRLEELQTLLAAQHGRQARFREGVERRLPELQGFWTSEEDDKEWQKRLQTCLENVVAPLDDTLEQMVAMVSNSITTLALQMDEFQKPVALAVTLDESGRVQNVSRIGSYS